MYYTLIQDNVNIKMHTCIHFMMKTTSETSIMKFAFLMYVIFILSTAGGDRMPVSIGNGCPSNWARCARHCRSDGYYTGFCIRLCCVCAPDLKTLDAEEADRAFKEAREKVKDLLQL